MKKLLLFGLAIGLSFGGFAQKKEAHKMVTKNTSEIRADIDFTQKSKPITTNKVELKSGNAVTLERVELGKSGNAYSMLTSYQRCLAYDPTTGALLGTFRADPDSHAGALSSGTVMGHISSDNGNTWTPVMVANPNPDDHALRYPSGVLFNENGSSNPDDLYIVAAGPAHTAGVWDNTFYSSIQANGENATDYYWEWAVADGNEWARSSMTVVPDAVYNMGLDYEDAGDAGLNQTMIQYYGTTDDAADGFEWDYNEVTPDWLEDPVDGNSYALYTTWSAWSKDGSIGYMWMIGATDDSEEYGGYQPQVFFTEDAGDSWDEIELDMEDHPALVEYIAPWEDAAGNPGTVKPTMGISQTGSRNFPGVVDASGKLHIFAPLFGSSKESVTDPESGYFTMGNANGGHIYDIILNEDGLQDMIMVDSIMAGTPADDIFGGVSWDHRLQASKSVDETMVFAVWADDKTNEEAVLNNPNLFGWGYNTVTGEATDVVNFTGEDLYAGFYFYHYVGELTPIVDGFYQIPVTTSVTPVEFGSNDPTAAVTHHFVKGIGFEAPTVGVDNSIAQTAVTVSQNQPNPATNYTNIQVTTEKSEQVVVEVVNMMGQTVLNLEAGSINGTKNITINTSDLKAGVYFYTVSVGNTTVSKKMIVE